MNPPRSAPGAHANLPLQSNGQYAAYQYLDTGAEHRFSANVVDTNGYTYTKALTFWAT